jgi:hypothetical protein
MATVDRAGGRLTVLASFLDRSEGWLEESHQIQARGSGSRSGRDSLYEGDPHMVTEPV